MMASLVPLGSYGDAEHQRQQWNCVFKVQPKGRTKCRCFKARHGGRVEQECLAVGLIRNGFAIP